MAPVPLSLLMSLALGGCRAKVGVESASPSVVAPARRDQQSDAPEDPREPPKHYLVADVEGLGPVIVIEESWDDLEDLDDVGAWSEDQIYNGRDILSTGYRRVGWDALLEPELREQVFTLYDHRGIRCQGELRELYQLAVYCEGERLGSPWPSDRLRSRLENEDREDEVADAEVMHLGGQAYLVATTDCPGVYARTGDGARPRFIGEGGDPHLTARLAEEAEVSARAASELPLPEELEVKTRTFYDPQSSTYYVATSARYYGACYGDWANCLPDGHDEFCDGFEEFEDGDRYAPPPDCGDEEEEVVNDPNGAYESFSVYAEPVEPAVEEEGKAVVSLDYDARLVAIGDINGDGDMEVFYRGSCTLAGMDTDMRTSPSSGDHWTDRWLAPRWVEDYDNEYASQDNE